jgi:hypothetical protein
MYNLCKNFRNPVKEYSNDNVTSVINRARRDQVFWSRSRHGHEDLIVVTVTAVTGRDRDRDRESRPFFLVCPNSLTLFLKSNYIVTNVRYIDSICKIDNVLQLQKERKLNTNNFQQKYFSYTVATKQYRSFRDYP